MSGPLDRRRGTAWWMVTIGIYVVVSLLYFVVPLGRRFGSALLGTEIFPHDAILSSAILEWGFKSLWSPHLHLFEWTAGYPVHHSLGLLENLVGWQIVYSPLRAIGASIPAAYNVALLASLVVSGIGAALLARRFGADRDGAMVAGLIFAYVPFHLVHALQLQTMSACFAPFAILFLDRLLDEPNAGNAAGLAAAVVATTLTGLYFAFFLLLMLPLYLAFSLAVGRARLSARGAAFLCASAVVAMLAVLPVILPYVRGTSEGTFHHPVSSLVKFSMDPRSFLRPPEWQWAWSWWPRLGLVSEEPAFPGIVAGILVLIALAAARRRQDLRRASILLLLFGAVAAILAMGPYLKVGHERIPLPGQIFRLIPPFRWPLRIMFYALLSFAVLAGSGTTLLLERLGRRRRIAAALIVLLIVVEYAPRTWYARKSVELPPPLEISDAYPFLAREADRGAIVELPGAEPGGYRTPPLVRYVYGSAGHLRRVVAFVGNARPPQVEALQEAAGRLPDPAARVFLVRSGVTRLVVHRTMTEHGQFEATVGVLRQARLPVLHAGSESVVFGLR